MADADIALINRAYELWAAGDFDGLLELVADDVVWIPPSYALEPGTYLVLATTATRGRGSGVETTIDVAHLITIANGEFTRVEVFADRPTAFERAGIDPD